MIVGLPNSPSTAGSGGLKRTIPRAPLDTFEHRGFLAADIRARAEPDFDVEGVPVPSTLAPR